MNKYRHGALKTLGSLIPLLCVCLSFMTFVVCVSVFTVCVSVFAVCVSVFHAFVCCVCMYIHTHTRDNVCCVCMYIRTHTRDNGMKEVSSRHTYIHF